MNDVQLTPSSASIAPFDSPSRNILRPSFRSIITSGSVRRPEVYIRWITPKQAMNRASLWTVMLSYPVPACRNSQIRP